jgi:hypothetical protein
VAERSKAWTVFAFSKAGIVSSNSTQSMNICLCLFRVCIGSGLATGLSPIQIVLPTVLRLRNWSETKRLKDAACSKVAATGKRESLQGIIIIRLHYEYCTNVTVQNHIEFVGSEVLTALVMKSSIFWDIKPCSPLKCKRYFGVIYPLYLLGQSISQGRYQYEPISEEIFAGFLLGLFLYRKKATCSSETSVGFQLTTLRYIPQDKSSYRTIAFIVGLLR